MTRAPAHPGTALKPLRFHELQDANAARLKAATGAARVERAVHPTPAPVGYYRLSGGELPTPVFAKVLTNAQMMRERPASILANRAARAGLPALHTLGEAIALEDTHHVMYWPWVEARFSTCTATELASLGAALRHLHTFLRAQATPDWQARGQQALESTWQRLEHLAHAPQLQPHLAHALQQLIQDRVGVEACLMFQAQPIHDDLHRGNVLFDRQGQIVAFLDFEEALDAFATPWMDLSWAIERFCVGPDAATTRQKTAQFLQAYQPNGFSEPASTTDYRLQRLTLWRNMRALALLHQMPERPYHWNQEWEKFSQLIPNSEF